MVERLREARLRGLCGFTPPPRTDQRVIPPFLFKFSSLVCVAGSSLLNTQDAVEDDRVSALGRRLGCQGSVAGGLRGVQGGRR